MRQILMIISFAFLTMIGAAHLLNAKTFVRDYTYHAGEADSKITSRSIALNQVKALLLEEIGVYVESTFNETSQESKSGIEQLTKQQIISITAGITETQIIEEKWDGFTYYIKAVITADVDDVKQKIETITQNRDRTNELEEVQRKADEALRQIELLRVELAKTKDNSEKERLKSEYQTKSDELSAADWFRRGSSAVESKDYDRAITYYNKAVANDPGYVKAYGNMGNIYADKGEYDKAIKLYEKVISISPNDANAYCNMALAYDSKNDFDKAVELYEKAISIDSTNPDFYYNKGIAHEKNGDYGQRNYCLIQAARLGDRDAQKFLKGQGIRW